MHSMIIHHWSYVWRHTKISFRPGTERNQVFTWIFDPRMKFCRSAEDWDEQVSTWDHLKHQKPNDQIPR